MQAQPLHDRLRSAASWVTEKRDLATAGADEIDRLVGTIALHVRPRDLDRLVDLLTEAADAAGGAR